MAESNPTFADTPAGTWRIIASATLDFAVTALLVTAVTLWALACDLPRALTMSLSATVTIALASTWWLLRTHLGTSPGHLLLGLRAVDPVMGLPGRLPGFHAVDIRRGQDPLRPRPRPIALDTTAPKRPPVDVTLIASLDDGSSYRLDMPCVIGRDPRVAPPYHCLAVTDISRTISRTHLMLWSESGLLSLSDMGSRGGTAIVAPRGDHPLPADQTVSLPMAPGLLAHLRLGRRELRIDAIPNLPGTR